MGSFAPMLCLLTACHPAGARAFLHGSLVLGCPSDRAHDPRVVELGIEELSLPPAFPGHPLPAANTASFSGTFLAPGTDVTSDRWKVNCGSPGGNCGSPREAAAAVGPGPFLGHLWVLARSEDFFRPSVGPRETPRNL